MYGLGNGIFEACDNGVNSVVRRKFAYALLPPLVMPAIMFL